MTEMMPDDPMAIINSVLGGGATSGESTIGRVYIGDYYNIGTTVSGGTAGVVRKETLTLKAAKDLYYTDKNLQKRWMNTLKKYGLETDNPDNAGSLWEMAVTGASKWYANSGGRAKITPEQFIAWNAKTDGGKKEGPSVTRQVYMSDPATVKELINNTVTNVLGRKATESEMTDFYGAIQKMMQDGTVTTQKVRVRNGVPETVVTQKQGFSQQRAEAEIEASLKAKSPQDYAEKKSLDFLDFLFGGGQ